MAQKILSNAILAASLALLVSGCASRMRQDISSSGLETPSRIRFVDVVVGGGPKVKPNSMVSLKYALYLHESPGFSITGLLSRLIFGPQESKFLSTGDNFLSASVRQFLGFDFAFLESGSPAVFLPGEKGTSAAWSEALVGMNVGGKRRLQAPFEVFFPTTQGPFQKSMTTIDVELLANN